MSHLDATRSRVHADVWQALIPVVQNHPLLDYFLEDPLTRWSYHKPRGYSGDAQLLDYIYCDPHVAESVANASKIGKELYSHTKNVPSCIAARERRDLLTRYVDEIAIKNGAQTEVLAIAAGHLREANRSPIRKGRLKRWVALDQDPQSVGLITRDFRAPPSRRSTARYGPCSRGATSLASSTSSTPPASTTTSRTTSP